VIGPLRSHLRGREKSLWVDQKLEGDHPGGTNPKKSDGRHPDSKGNTSGLDDEILLSNCDKGGKRICAQGGVVLVER